MLKLKLLEERLKRYPGFRGFNSLQIILMQKGLKKSHWGLCYKKSLQADGKEILGANGIVYINYRDSRDANKVLKVIAHEAAHLLGDKKGERKKLLKFIEGE